MGLNWKKNSMSYYIKKKFYELLYYINTIFLNKLNSLILSRYLYKGESRTKQNPIIYCVTNPHCHSYCFYCQIFHLK